MVCWLTVAAVLGGALLIPVGCFSILLFFFPHIIIKYSIRLRQYFAGMSIKYVGDEEMVLRYAEKNSPQPGKTSIVFVHGFTCSIDQWISCFKGLPQDLHMVAVDLPGHGSSKVPDETIDLNYNYSVHILDKFFEWIGLTDIKVHLVGISLGAAISAGYAAKHPERVEKISLGCPPMQSPIESDFQKEIKAAVALGPEKMSYEHCRILARDVEGIKRLMMSATYKHEKIKLNKQIYKGILTLRLPQTAYYLRLFKNIALPDNLDFMINIAPEITSPSQIVWGRHDEFFHVSAIDGLKSKLPNCRHVDIIEECGHAIDIDRPGYLNKVLLKFIRDDVTHPVDKKEN